MLSGWHSWASVERGLAPSTVTAYRRELQALADASGGALIELGPPELRSFITERGGSPATVARRVAAVRSYYRWAVRTGERADDPSALLDRPKVHRGLPRPLADEARSFAQLDPETRNVAVLLVETGLRISEAMRLEVAVPAPEQIIVFGKGSKERLMPLTERARTALDAMGGSISCSARTIQRRFQAAGFTPHRLRHTFGTSLAESGADLGEIQDLLGHASPATSRVYAQYSLGRLRRALERRRSP